MFFASAHQIVGTGAKGSTQQNSGKIANALDCFSTIHALPIDLRRLYVEIEVAVEIGGGFACH